MPTLSSLFGRRPQVRPSPKTHRQLRVEHLEDRSVPAGFDPTFGAGGALQIGGAGSEGAFQMARDAGGNMAIVGGYSTVVGSTDFDPGTGVTALASQGGLDGFVARYAADGSLLWARGLGGADYDKATAVAVDAAGNTCVGGQVSGPVDLDLTTTYPDNRDLVAGGGYVAQFAADGQLGWVWQSSGGIGWSDVADLALDGAGNVVATGSYPNPAGSWVATSVVTVGHSGEQVWRKDIAGGKGAFVVRGLAVDAGGNVVLAGVIRGTIDVDPGTATTSLSSNSVSAVVEKLGPAGAFVWTRQMAATGSDSRVEGYDVAVDGAGSVYTVGYYQGKADLDPGKAAYTLTAPAGGGSYVSKLDAAGNFAWARGLGSGDNSPYRLALDAAGGVYLAGQFDGSGDFNPGAGTHTLTSAGQTDVFVMKLDAAGAFQWAFRMGGTDYDYVAGLAVDAGGDVYLAGRFNLTAEFGGLSLTSNGAGDIFVVRIKQP